MTNNFRFEFRDGKKIILKYVGNEQNVIIPDDIEAIGQSAFEGCSGLKSVVFPDGLKEIGPAAFKRCNSLSTVSIPGTVKEIAGLDFPYGGAFEDCSNLISVDIQEGVNIIGKLAFRNCTSLTNVHIPGSVTEICYAAFAGCKSLASVSISEGLIEIGNTVFYDCISLKEITIPQSVNKIGEYAFTNCSSLASAEIQNGIEVIDKHSFSGCTSLLLIRLPASVTQIEDGAFSGCSSMTTVELNEGLKVIGSNAFADCTSLRNIRIPNSVIEINENAFARCTNLNTMFIPNGVTRIGEGAFKGCQRVDIKVLYHHRPSEQKIIKGFRYKYIILVDEENQEVSKLFILNEIKYPPDNEFISRLMSGMVKNLSEFDELFPSIEDIVISKVRAAICRLEHPLDLHEKNRKSYIEYLQKNATIIIPVLIHDGDVPLISFLLDIDALHDENVDKYIEMANKYSQSEILVLFMNYKDNTLGKEKFTTYKLEANEQTVEWETKDNEDGSLTISKYLGKSLDVAIPSILNSRKVKGIEGKIGSLNINIFFQNKNHIQSITI